jgi:hypothetical protein
MAGVIERLSSRNHRVEVKMSADNKSAEIRLAQDVDRRNVPNKDFVLYFRDSKINEPAGYQSRNEYNEQTILLNFLVDLRTKRTSEQKSVDTDQT